MLDVSPIPLINKPFQIRCKRRNHCNNWDVNNPEPCRNCMYNRADQVITELYLNTNKPDHYKPRYGSDVRFI